MLDIRAIRAPRCGSGGPTLLSMLNLRARNKSASRIMRLQQADRVRLRQKFEEETGIKVDELGGIVVDEVSFLPIAKHLGTWSWTSGFVN